MSKHAHILPFEQAKQTGTIQDKRWEVPSLSRGVGMPTYESPFRSASSHGQHVRSQSSKQTVSRVSYDQASHRLSSVNSARFARTSAYSGAHVARPSVALQQQKALRATNNRSSLVALDANDFAEDGQAERFQKSSLRERVAQKRKAQTKERAGKKFLRQYGDDDSVSSSSASSASTRQGDSAQEGTPRAAVYRGKMGASQKKSSRMQRSKGFALGFGGLATFSLRGVLSALVATNARLVSIVACLIVLGSGMFLYPTAQQYYHTVREHDRLQAEYAALEQRNDNLERNVSSLGVDSGVEQRAHEQFGWVKEGEETAAVRGLSVENADSTSLQANITSDSIEAPETWYSPLLDTFFGVE